MALLILPTLDTGSAIFANGTSVRRVAMSNLAQIGGGDVTLILPGQWVRIFDTDLPKSARAQQLKMARFAREDDIASAADDLHFALSDAQPPRLAVMSRAQLQDVIGTCRAAGLQVKAAFADYDILSGDQGVLVIDRAVEPAQAAVDLDWTDAPLAQPSDADLAAEFAMGVTEGAGVNFMQGEFRARSGFDIPKIPAIRFAALAATALVAFLGWQAVQGGAALQQAEDLRARTASDYTALTGNPAPTRPGRAAAKAAQVGPAAQTGFLDLSAVLFAALAGENDIRLDQLRFDRASGMLRLRLVYPDFDGAGRVERAVRAAGGSFETGGVREQDGVFIGDATLSLGGGA